MLAALRRHWPEYLMEATELGLFMLVACFFAGLLEYPASPVHHALPLLLLRRVLIGIAMGLTAIALIYSPLGKRSGAHFNPAVTLTFFRLGKVAPWDAAFYIGAQFLGGVGGVEMAANVFPTIVAHPAVYYVATRPGPWGAVGAFAGESLIAFLQMTLVLHVSNTPRLARFTGLFAGTMVALYIMIESPLSGMSMNPARTFGSAFAAQDWTALWVYFTAPLLGMFLAAEVYLRRWGRAAIGCAKMHHQNTHRCIFCEWQQTRQSASAADVKPAKRSA